LAWKIFTCKYFSMVVVWDNGGGGGERGGVGDMALVVEEVAVVLNFYM